MEGPLGPWRVPSCQAFLSRRARVLDLVGLMFTSPASSPTWHRGRLALAPELTLHRSEYLRHRINHTSILSRVHPAISRRPRVGRGDCVFLANATSRREVKGFEAIIRVFIALRTLAGG